MQEGLQEEGAGDAVPGSGVAHRARGPGAGCTAPRGTAGTRQGTRLGTEPTGTRALRGTPPLGQAPPPAVAVPWSPRGHPMVVPWSPCGHPVVTPWSHRPCTAVAEAFPDPQLWLYLNTARHSERSRPHRCCIRLTPSPLPSAGVPQTPPDPAAAPTGTVRPPPPAASPRLRMEAACRALIAG